MQDTQGLDWFLITLKIKDITFDEKKWPRKSGKRVRDP